MEQCQLKRPIDLVQVVPSVESSIKKLRTTLALEELKKGTAYTLMERNHAIILDKPLVAMVDPNAKYIRINWPTMQDIVDGILPTQTEELEKALKSIGQVFTECVIANGNNFVLVTQLDVFISNQSALDDCAYPVENRNLALFSAYLKEKTRFRSSWRELITQTGYSIY